MLVNQIEQINSGSLSGKPERVMMHCLAGRGRTGTAIAIVNAMIALKAQMIKNVTIDDLQLSVFSIVRRLREQRATAVQSRSQYIFIYQLVATWTQLMQ